MTSGAQPLASPAIGSAWLCPQPGEPRPLDAGTLAPGGAAHLPVLGAPVRPFLPGFLPGSE